MFDYIIIGSGIGAAGFISKSDLQHKKVCIISNNINKITNFASESCKFKYEYLSRGKFGNAHNWGGVLSLSSYVLQHFESNFFQKALINYFSFGKKQSHTNPLICESLKHELMPKNVTPTIFHRKLLISDNKLLEKSYQSNLDERSILKLSTKVVKIVKHDDCYILKTADNVELKSKKIVLCCGAIHTRELLINSGIMKNTNFYATDSKFGRVGRLRFEQPLPFGFFHHHLISKKIRFKTGFEINNSKGNAMFFLQPAIRGVPATELHLLKEFLKLKTKFSLKNLFKLVLNPKVIIQILLMEFSFLDKTTDFDVYCIADYGKREYTPDYKVNLEGFSTNLCDSYNEFIKFLTDYSKIIKIDHNDNDSPKLDNMESALHMCGTVSYNLDITYNKESRLYNLSSDENIIINDNSIITSKGVANPSLQLF